MGWEESRPQDGFLARSYSATLWWQELFRLLALSISMSTCLHLAWMPYGASGSWPSLLHSCMPWKCSYIPSKWPDKTTSSLTYPLYFIVLSWRGQAAMGTNCNKGGSPDHQAAPAQRAILSEWRSTGTAGSKRQWSLLLQNLHNLISSTFGLWMCDLGAYLSTRRNGHFHRWNHVKRPPRLQITHLWKCCSAQWVLV